MTCALGMEFLVINVRVSLNPILSCAPHTTTALAGSATCSTSEDGKAHFFSCGPKLKKLATKSMDSLAYIVDFWEACWLRVVEEREQEGL
jgi:hypothetical protein